jgi:hypothetical protein
MTTPRVRTIVSRAAALALSLVLGACAGRQSAASDAAATVSPARPLTVRFDNEAQVHVHVYLVGERREWLLGRVAPGARATLRIPAEAATEQPAFVRLAVLSNTSVSMRAARDPRAAITIAQPTSDLVSQRWAYTQRYLAAPELFGMRLGAARP